MGETFLTTTPFQLNDINQFFELTKEPDIRKEFPNLRIETIEEATLYLKHQIEINDNSKISFFKAIRILFNEKETDYTDKNNILLGFISLHKTGAFDQMLAGGFEQTLAYALKSRYRRKGLMTTALNMTLDAMTLDGYNVLPAIVKHNNIASIRVLEKCGFIMVRDNKVNLLYVKRISMEENEFKRIFGL